MQFSSSCSSFSCSCCCSRGEQFKQGKAHRTPLNFILHIHTVLHACYVVMEIINDCVIKKGNSSRGCSFSWGLLLFPFFFLLLRAQLINRLSACAECVEQVFFFLSLSLSLPLRPRSLCIFLILSVSSRETEQVQLPRLVTFSSNWNPAIFFV